MQRRKEIQPGKFEDFVVAERSSDTAFRTAVCFLKRRGASLPAVVPKPFAPLRLGVFVLKLAAKER